MTIRINERCGPRRRRSTPLIAKRSSRRRALSERVGSGQRGAGAARAARAAAKGNAGRSPGRGGSNRAPSSRPSCAAPKNGSSRPLREVMRERGDEHRLATLTQAGHRKAQDLLAGEPGGAGRTPRWSSAEEGRLTTSRSALQVARRGGVKARPCRQAAPGTPASRIRDYCESAPDRTRRRRDRGCAPARRAGRRR